MDGWMDGWMDGCGCMKDYCTDLYFQAWMDGKDRKGTWMEQWKDWHMDGWMDGWMGDWMGGWVDR